MKVLVAIKRVVDFNARITVKPDGSGVDTSNDKMSAPTEPSATASDPRLPGRSTNSMRNRYEGTANTVAQRGAGGISAGALDGLGARACSRLHGGRRT